MTVFLLLRAEFSAALEAIVSFYVKIVASWAWGAWRRPYCDVR
jgi:hypothetical protein